MTYRSILIGIAIVVFVNVASPYTESRAFSNFSWSYLPEGGMIPFLLVLFLNLLLRRFLPRSALTSGELLLIFLMALVSNSTPLFLVYMFLSAIVSPLYFSTPENSWDTDLIPLMRSHLIVKDRRAVEWFYHGLPSGGSIPWKAWLIPLSSWFPFLIALLLASYLIVILFRRQWTERERLSFPLMKVPIALVGNPSILRSKLFWLGASIPFSIMSLHVLHSLFPVVPSLPVDHIGCLNWGWSPVRGQPLLCFNFLAFGVGYFVPKGILISIFLFYVFTLFEELAFNRFGLRWGYGGMVIWGNAAIAWQSMGAFMVLVISFMLRAKVIKVLREGDELLPRPYLQILLVLCLIFIPFWLYLSGMPFKAVAIFVPMVFVIYLGLSRVVCQSGIFYVVPPVIAQNVAIYSLGSHLIGKEGMVSLALSYSWHGDVQTVLPALSAEGFKLYEGMGPIKWRYSLAIFLTVLIGLLSASFSIIHLGYRQGAINWDTWIFRGWGPSVYGQILSQIYHPFGFTAKYFLWFGVGASLMVALTYLHLRFLWWPIHPIGLAVASSFTMYAVYLGAFFAWAVKHVLLSWCGMKTYRAASPFFVGIVVGHFLGRALMLIVSSWLRIHLI